MHVTLVFLWTVVAVMTASCGAPSAPPPTKTIDAGTSADALPPVPPSPVIDARLLPN